MTECVRCKAKSDQFGCAHCVSKLRKLLADLPEWLAELEATAAGQAKMGGTVRRSPRYRQVLDGDAHPIALFPKDGEEDLAKAILDRYDAVRRDALSRGRVNARASELADKAHGVLLMWVRDLCETRGIKFPTFTTRPRNTGPVEDQPPPPWIDATTIHVDDGDPGQLCEECDMYHRGECAW
jgi:hypothetical protein